MALSAPKCPICRTRVSGIVKVFDSGFKEHLTTASSSTSASKVGGGEDKRKSKNDEELQRLLARVEQGWPDRDEEADGDGDGDGDGDEDEDGVGDRWTEILICVIFSVAISATIASTRPNVSITFPSSV